MRRETQCSLIKNHLEKYGFITPLEAMNDYGIMRLASRMHDLKEQGYAFTAEKTKVLNRNSEVCTVCVYRKS